MSNIKPILNYQLKNGQVVRMDLFPDVHSFGIKLMYYCYPYVKINYKRKIYLLSTSKLWEELLNCLVVLFPKALAEALSKSKEMPASTQRSEGFGFSSQERIKEY